MPFALAAVLVCILAVRIGFTTADNRRLRARVAGSAEEFHHFCTHDPLTDLPGRALALSTIDERADDRPQAVILIDLDHFGVVNETVGHAWGDAMLVTVAGRIQQALTERDTLARIAGDEFAVIAPGVDEATAATLAERIRRQLGLPVTLSGIDVVPTATIGIAVGRPDTSGSELLQNASLACGRAKASALGTIAVFDPEMRHRTDTRAAIAHDLRHALVNDEFEVYYQPVVQLGDGIVMGAEALIRWNHPSRGVLAPDEWLDVAAETGALVDIGRATLAVSCRRFATLNRTRVDKLSVAVNLCAAELRADGVVESIVDLLASSGLHANLLAIEVSEDVFADADIAATLTRIHSIGVRLAIDDFGTAYSSLLQLRRFPVDIIKLDQAFVDGAPEHPADAAIVTAVCGLARGLGATVVAEGVTTEAQVELLRAEGCDLAQGWLYGRAVPFPRLVEFLRRSDAGLSSPTPTTQRAR